MGANASSPATLALRAAGPTIDPHEEDAHWSRCYAREHGHRTDRDYEDFAPAYCVGYVGFSQYGGSYADAEISLHANWVRIRGDSRLSLEEARVAMRAAWDRVAARAPAPCWTHAERSADEQVPSSEAIAPPRGQVRHAASTA